MAERMLIVKVKRTSATQAELYGKQHKYPDLKLFDLGELAAVGLDPAALQIGIDSPARFWAVYELSDKLNQKGNPYKDILMLEPIGGPATTTSTAVGDPAILGELRAIRTLLEMLVQAQGLWLPTPREQDTGDEDWHSELEAGPPADDSPAPESKAPAVGGDYASGARVANQLDEWFPREEPAPGPVVTNGNGKRLAVVKAKGWQEAMRKFAVVYPFYQKPDGSADPYHMLAALAKMGVGTVTDENLTQALDILRTHAAEAGQPTEEAA